MNFGIFYLKTRKAPSFRERRRRNLYLCYHPEAPHGVLVRQSDARPLQIDLLPNLSEEDALAYVKGILLQAWAFYEHQPFSYDVQAFHGDSRIPQIILPQA